MVWPGGKTGFCKSCASKEPKMSKPKQKPWINDGVYTSKFLNDTIFRISILIDQNKLCAVCGYPLFKKRKQLHHINFNKADDRRKNLIYLCPTCHGKTQNRTTYKETIDFLYKRNSLIILESIEKERIKLN